MYVRLGAVLRDYLNRRPLQASIHPRRPQCQHSTGIQGPRTTGSHAPHHPANHTNRLHSYIIPLTELTTAIPVLLCSSTGSKIKTQPYPTGSSAALL